MYKTLENLYGKYIEKWEVEEVSSVKEIIPVVGITLPQRKRLVNLLKVGEQLRLKRDPDNPYDSDAIQVLNEAGLQIGFVAKDWACIYAPKLDLGMVFEATIILIENKVIKVSIERSNKDEELVYDFLKKI